MLSNLKIKLANKVIFGGFILFIMLLTGCANTSDMSCSQTRLVTPLVVALQKHAALITHQNVIVTPDC